MLTEREKEILKDYARLYSGLIPGQADNEKFDIILFGSEKQKKAMVAEQANKEQADLEKQKLRLEQEIKDINNKLTEIKP